MPDAVQSSLAGLCPLTLMCYCSCNCCTVGTLACLFAALSICCYLFICKFASVCPLCFSHNAVSSLSTFSTLRIVPTLSSIYHTSPCMSNFLNLYDGMPVSMLRFRFACNCSQLRKTFFTSFDFLAFCHRSSSFISICSTYAVNCWQLTVFSFVVFAISCSLLFLHFLFLH